METNNNKNELSPANLQLVKTIRQLLGVIVALLCGMFSLMFFLIFGVPDFIGKKNTSTETTAAISSTSTEKSKSKFWEAPDSATISDEEVRYGKELIAHTSEYLGPNGKVMKTTNGMNCQNCHLDAGTKVFGNNYSAVASTYPKFRARSGTSENIEKRVNDCIERSLNGKALENAGKEMKAIVAYIKWVGKDVPKGESPKGSGLVEVPFLERAADPGKGKLVYDAKCKSCHQANGNGLLNTEKTAYTYPPLWGEHSYNYGAGLFRLSRFAGYVKANMPLGATHANTQLTDEEAWDVAAFANSQPRPKKDLSADWPDISKKPVDHPFGPYSDEFSEQQHKYGPFPPIKKAAQEKKKTT
ncbi:MAG: c-type cytochrome [Bacteroidota bacterium]